MSSPEIKNDTVVSIHYVLTLDDGQEIDRSDVKSPLQYLHGYQNIIIGLENALTGLTAGADLEVTIPAKEAYGEADPENVARVHRNVFPKGFTLEEGAEVSLQNPETDEIASGVIAEINPDNVVIDLNHPLAGETLHFSVEVVDVRDATSNELAHGHVHE